MKIKDKIIIFVVGAVFFIVGIFMIVYSGDYDKQEKDFYDNAVSVQAYVDKVETDTSHHGNSHRTNSTAWVTYEVDGVKYTNIKLSEGAGRLTEGTYEIIYYHQDDPTSVRAYIEDRSMHHIILKIMGGLCCFFGFFGLLGAFIGKPQKKYKRTVYTRDDGLEMEAFEENSTHTKMYDSDVEDYR